ncbi:MAG: succinate dehydrogenase cytochrome b subunit [Gemmatimonadaceae bacterium]|nr:succinate dehydrogenase cytochrome b subunit [Gemmatimonadaceae bacterium]
MNMLLTFWRSTIGKKVVMGVTGLIGLGFVIGHMAGNLQAFSGAEKLDAYGALLHGPLHELLLIARVVLIAAVILHITAAYQLTMISRAARPVDYAGRKPQVSTLASKTLKWGGVLLLVFIVFHILHFTIGTVHPDFVDGKVYRNLATGFEVKWVAAFYLVAMIALGMHLYHGAWSSMRTLGLARQSAHPLKRYLPVALAIVISLGFAVIPLAFLLGVLR